jgi:hypothetical protein
MAQQSSVYSARELQQSNRDPVRVGKNDRVDRRSEVFFWSEDHRPFSSPMFTKHLSFEIESDVHPFIY